MRNPVPKRFRRPLSNVLFFVLVYLALTGLHALVDGREPIPSTIVLVGFAIGATIAVWSRAALQEERA
jgi:hypothetical protein